MIPQIWWIPPSAWMRSSRQLCISPPPRRPRPSVRRANGIFSAKRRYEKWWGKKWKIFGLAYNLWLALFHVALQRKYFMWNHCIKAENNHSRYSTYSLGSCEGEQNAAAAAQWRYFLKSNKPKHQRQWIWWCGPKLKLILPSSEFHHFIFVHYIWMQRTNINLMVDAKTNGPVLWISLILKMLS